MVGRRKAGTGAKNKSDIVLDKYQIEHYESIIGILEESFFYIDASPMGTGKTYVTAKIAIDLGLALIVVGENDSPWRKMTDSYNVPGYVGYLSYSRLAGKAGSSLSHPFLNRYDEEKGDDVITTFEPTQYFLDMCKYGIVVGRDENGDEIEVSGIMLAFDEAQNIKNPGSLASRAASTLTNAIINTEGKSRFALLSATLMDRKEKKNLIANMRLMGFTSAAVTHSYKKIGKVVEYIPEGLAEIINAAEYIKKDEPFMYDEELAFLAGDASRKDKGATTTELIETIYFDDIIPTLTSVMQGNISRRVYRGFFEIRDEVNIEIMKRGIEQVIEATGVNTDDPDHSISFHGVNEGLMNMENASIDDMVRIQHEWLEENDGNKAIIMCMHLDPLIKAFDMFDGYGPLFVSGGVKGSDRDERIRLFNEVDEYRVMLITIGTGSATISLHDTIGGHKRKLLFSPSFSMIDMHQATGRIFRKEQKSVGEAYIFYPSMETEIVAKIMELLAKKSQVARRVKSKRSTVSNMPLPGHYPRFYEGYGFVDEVGASGSIYEEVGVMYDALVDGNAKALDLLYEPEEPPLEMELPSPEARSSPISRLVTDIREKPVERREFADKYEVNIPKASQFQGAPPRRRN